MSIETRMAYRLVTNLETWGEFWPTFPGSKIYSQRVSRTLFVGAQRWGPDQSKLRGPIPQTFIVAAIMHNISIAGLLRTSILFDFALAILTMSFAFVIYQQCMSCADVHYRVLVQWTPLFAIASESPQHHACSISCLEIP